MNKTRSFLWIIGFSALLVCGSNCVAQEWHPIVPADGPALSPVQAVAQPVYQPAVQQAPLPVVAPAAYPPANPLVIPPAPQSVAQAAPALAPMPEISPEQVWPPEFLKQLPHPPEHPTTLLDPATPQLYSCPSPFIPSHYFEDDPLLAPPNGSQLGWYATLELEWAMPHIYKDVTNSVVAGSRPPDTVALPNRGLDGTVAPLLEIGYHLPEAAGSIALSYRFLSTTGSATTFGPDGLAALQSRMDLNVVDLDYVSQQLFIKDEWSMRWRVGARLAYLYYDSVLNQSLAEAAPGTGILQQQATNHYWGIGPHIALEMTHPFGNSGWSLLGKIDFASIVGRINQGVSETALDPASPTGVSFGQTAIGSSQTCPTTSMSLGLNWQPPSWQNVNLFVGYQYEYWWNVGRLSEVQDSRGELQFQGLMAQFQLNY